MRLLLALLAIALSLPAAAGTVVSREFDSSALQRKWTYAVYLPDSYESSTLRYPVLYLLHGHNGNLYDWVNLGHIQQTADEMIARGDMPPAIIVMPDAVSGCEQPPASPTSATPGAAHASVLMECVAHASKWSCLSASIIGPRMPSGTCGA